MVLHNNKWDKKAKYNYLKKHGLLPKQRQTQVEEKKVHKKWSRKDEKELSDDSENEDSEFPALSNETRQPGSNDRHDGIYLGKEKKGVDAELEDETKDEGTMTEATSEAVAGEAESDMNLNLTNIVKDAVLNDQDIDDEQFIEYVRLTRGITKTYEPIGKNSKSAKKLPDKMEDYTLDDMEQFFEQESAKNAKNKSQAVQRILEGDEIEHFNELQVKIDKDKTYRTIRDKFAPQDSTRKKRFDETDEKNGGINENLRKLLGDLDLNDESDTLSKARTTNFDDLLDLDTKSTQPAPQKAPKKTPFKVQLKKNKKLDLNEKELDDLLDL